jgi:hypothetical protein
MIGWWIVISTQTPEERSAANPDERKACILATWEAGIGGLDWLDRLVAQSAAQKVRADGYPTVYLASAGAVIPLLVDGPPTHDGRMVIGDDYVMPPKWIGKVEMHAERMKRCPAQQRLTVEAWDLS